MQASQGTHSHKSNTLLQMDHPLLAKCSWHFHYISSREARSHSLPVLIFLQWPLRSLLSLSLPLAAILIIYILVISLFLPKVFVASVLIISIVIPTLCNENFLVRRKTPAYGGL